MSHPQATPSGATISLGLAVLPLLVLLAGFLVGGLTLGFESEVLIASMLAAATVAGIIATRRGASWDDLQRSTGEKLASVLPAILILLAIGMLIGSWVLSGTIPLLISWGVRLIHPSYFVLTAFVVTAVMSLATGTSWGSAGTLGVALMGAATAMQAPLAATAGAVVSGAYLGDKLSPLSDSTNLCAIGAGADLYAHIRLMLYTALPSAAVAALVFATLAPAAIAGDGPPPAAQTLLLEIERAFSPGLWALLPMVAVIAAILTRAPPALALAGSSLLAALIGIAGGFSVENALASLVHGFEISMLSAPGGAAEGGYSPLFSQLVERGGLYSMVDTLVVILSAFLLAAGLDVSGALDRLLLALLGAVRSTFRLIAVSMAAGATMISLTSHGGVTALIVGGMFQGAYRERELAPENLSRSLEDSVTIVEPLLPWTVSAIFMATTLGVPTVEYLPWAVFCYGGPLFSLLWAATFERLGFGLKAASAAS